MSLFASSDMEDGSSSGGILWSKGMSLFNISRYIVYMSIERLMSVL